MPPTAPLIKGYLPVRLKLPPTPPLKVDETFFYVREHAGKSEGSSKPGCTLFVVNCPVVPGVATKILLQSIFGRYADIPKVTVVANPRQDPSDDSSGALCWTKKFPAEPSCLPPIHSQGKYAHIIFKSTKDMKRTLRSLEDVMKPSSQGDEHCGLTLEKIEIQTLADETDRQYRKSQKAAFGRVHEGDDDSDSDTEEPSKEKLTGVHAVAARYRASFNAYSREELLAECNAVMKEYEEAEAAKKQAHEEAKSQPDDDGFVTVSYSTAVGSKIEMEESMTASTPVGRRGHKRSRKKKEAVGSSELKDFYRFQRRENRKRSLEDLRTQFEEDLKRVKKMKEERKYRPF